MHVGFYLKTTHLGNWDWEEILKGHVALSGTDGTTFRIVHTLAERSSIEVTFLTTNTGTTATTTSAVQVAVNDFSEAIRHAHTHHFDALVFNDSNDSEIVEGLRLAERIRQPCIAWCHVGPWWERSRLYANVDMVKRVICVSYRHADLYREKKAFSKIEVIYNGIDTRQYRPQNSQKNTCTVCYVGALTEIHGFHDVLQAWRRVRSSFPNARLIAVGSPRLYDREMKLGPLGVASPEYERTSLIPHVGNSREEAKDNFGITFTGLLPPKQVQSLMQSSLVGVVNPNSTTGALETFCVTAVEFQAAGTAVVGGRRRGLRETVRNGKTGELIDSPQQLSRALRELLAAPKKARRMGSRGQEWVSQKFNLAKIAKQWEDVLRATAQGQPPDPPPFSFRRATTKTVVREGLRHLHSIAGGDRLYPLDRLLEIVRGIR